MCAKESVYKSYDMVVSERQQEFSVVVEGISAVITDNFVMLAPHPSLRPPPRAGVDIYQHEQLFMFRYLLYSPV